jgi:hypothetical protein
MTLAGGSPGTTAHGLIAMWAAPRSRSTAFFRYMLEHGGLVALHEPFDNIADHGSIMVTGQPVSDPAELITTMRGLARTETVFFKETTDRRHHAVLADRRFLSEVTHTFLIRSPAEIAASCYALQGERLSLSICCGKSARGYPGSSNLRVRYVNQGCLDADRPHLSHRRAARIMLTRPGNLQSGRPRRSPRSPGLPGDDRPGQPDRVLRGPAGPGNGTRLRE